MPHYPLDVIRHSSAHLMAQAIEEVFPNEKVQLGIGPVIENGFYYDIEMNHRLADEDLIKIEEKMREIIKRDLPISRHSFSGKSEAKEYFSKKNQQLKIELITDFPEGEAITYYSHADEFMDLCTGPHVERTGHLPGFFKLLNVAGAYWRGDETRPMLQRVYAACFSSKEDLKNHLHFLEEAKKRDHRKLGKELELFLFDPSAPATPFFLPKGAFIINQFQHFVRQVLKKYDYQEVLAPQLLDSQLWKTSGHYDNYKEHMYFSMVDGREFALKPMNCPGHMLIYRSQRHSYRELPLRIAEFGRVHRHEKSGVVAGLTRVRGFCQDDAHLFLRMGQIEAEVLSLLEMFFITYRHFDYKNFVVNLSTRPEKKIGDDSLWDKAEDSLRKALDKCGHPYSIKEGDGAFYGPKIDFDLADAIGRFHQLGTIQLDFNLPERFDLTCTNEKSEQERIVVIHRALLGSLERFFGVYIEHVAGVFPFWLAPVQAVLIPVKNELHLSACQELAKRWQALGFRVKVDDREESMGLKTRQCQQSKIPFMLVMGDKEIESGQVSLRRYGEKQSEVIDQSTCLSLFEQLAKQDLPPEFRL